MSDLTAIMRPKRFDDMVGMEEVIKRIRGHIAHKHSGNSMFTGQTGCGKTTLERIMALSLQCRHAEFGNPCKDCYKRRREFNIVEINASNFTGIEALRDILGAYNHSPMPGSRRRVYILDELHSMSDKSQDLLLKFTEDCPRTTVFLAGTTDPDKLRRALRRRFKIYSVPPLGLESIRKLVKKGLEQCNSERSVSDLVDKLMEKRVDSPGLIVRAIEKYADTDCTADEASNVELASNIDVLALCNSVRKGLWEDVSKALMEAAPEDMGIIKHSVAKYLNTILLGDGDYSKRTEIVANAILKLHDVRPEVPAVSAVLYKVCKYFSRYKR